ncbi:MAG: uroporphyrinogen-III synthase [Acidimicrobiales bacterium]
MGADRTAPPLAGRRIVVTRSEADNRSLAAGLSALGATVVEVPLVEVKPSIDGGRALAEAAAVLSTYRWVVLTSTSGVRALADALGGKTWPDGVAVAPVGPATEAAARAAGFTTIAPPPTATAHNLVASFPVSHGPADRQVLAPLAELAGDTVVAGLTAKGYRVRRVTAYRTADPGETGPADLTAADAVLFFSPSVVDRFLARFGSSAVPPVVVCVGPSTAARAGERDLAGIVTASPHTEAGVVDAVCHVLEHR